MVESTTRSTSVAGLRGNMTGLLCLAFASFLAVTTEMLPVGLLTTISRSFDVSESAAGLLVTLYAGLVAVLAVPLTVATRTMRRKPLLMSTIVGYAISNALVAAAPSIAMVAAGRVVGGISHALFFSLCIGYVPRLVGRDNVGRALALAAGGATAGFVLGVPLSTALGTAFGWRAAFVVLAVVSIATLASTAVLLPSVAGASGVTASPRPSRRLTAVATSNALAFVGHYVLYTYITVLLLSAGVTESAVGPWLLVFGTCGLVGLWLAGRTLDRRPRRTAVVVLGSVVATLAILGFDLSTFYVLASVVALWSTAFGAVPSLYQSAAVRTDSSSPELAGAWVNATSNVGIAAGAGLGGLVLPWAGVTGLAWCGALLVGAGLLVVIVGRSAFPER